jgi:hypothetical protein
MNMPAAVVLADRGFFIIGPIDLLKPDDHEARARGRQYSSQPPVGDFD